MTKHIHIPHYACGQFKVLEDEQIELFVKGLYPLRCDHCHELFIAPPPMRKTERMHG